MKHGSLFTGIGGFDLAAEWAGIENVWQVQYDPKSKSHDKYLIDLLKKNFPNARQINKDIAKVKGEELGYVDIISGGFPCQPYSIAGLRKGEEDDRALWHEMFRIIKEKRPPWVINENVAHFANMGLRQMLSDLESEGYEAQPVFIPACGLEAWHIRKRIWILAYRNGISIRDNEREFCETTKSLKKKVGLANREWLRNGFEYLHEILSDSHAGGFKKQQQSGISSQSSKGHFRKRPIKCNTWWQAEPGVGRVVHGLPQRVDRLKGLGNAIVPQIAYIIFSFIKQINDQLT